jgi:hypothetical protein
MSDTPQTDAFLLAKNCTPHNPAAFEWAIGLARSLERELAESRRDVNALMEDIRKGDDMLMAWFKAASPYATPGSLEIALRRFHRWEADAKTCLCLSFPHACPVHRKP